MAESFTIDQVSWHTEKQGALATLDQVAERFWAVVEFLQVNGLTVRQLASGIDEIDEGFSIGSDVLTDLGLQLMRQAYDPWLRALDKGMSPNKLRQFEREPAKLREEG